MEDLETFEPQRSCMLGNPSVDISVQSNETKKNESGQSLANCSNVDPMEFVSKANVEECRRILKRYRLRVTILRDSYRSPGTDLGTQEPQKVKGKNKAHAQISPQPLISFDLLQSKYGVSIQLLENIKAQGYIKPTEVQIGSLPLLLGSREDLGLSADTERTYGKRSNSELDLLTIAPTGSGKTLSFITHLLHGLHEDRRSRTNTTPKRGSEHQIKALILVPTHELASQVVNEGRKLALGTGIRVSKLRKGTVLHSRSVDQHGNAIGNKKSAAHGPDDFEQTFTNRSVVKADILVSTPLVLLHTITADKPSAESLSNVQFLVLDEADVLLDPLFRQQTLNIWTACSHQFLRTSLWSATVGSSIESLIRTAIVERRSKLGLRSQHHCVVRLVVGFNIAISNISHHLLYAASEQGKLLALRQLLHPSASSSKDVLSLQPPFLIFTQTIPRAIALHSELLYDIPVEAGGSSRIAVLHSDLSDTARSKIMSGFRTGEIWILITTDLLSRGIDFRGMNGIINYDLPSTSTSYVHRAGRTGRQGREGCVAATLYTKEDIPYVKSIVNVIAASGQIAKTNFNVKSEDKDTQKWLSKALPTVSKATKKVLKSKGVESRRVTNQKRGMNNAKMKMRISTKSGYDRRRENKRKFAVVDGKTMTEDEEWRGFEV